MNLTGWTKHTSSHGNMYQRRLTIGMIVRLYHIGPNSWHAAVYRHVEGQESDAPLDEVASCGIFREPEHALRPLMLVLDGVEAAIREAKQALGEL